MTALTIAFEGSDGAGKATQTDMLATFLEEQGKKVARVSFPRYNQTLGGTLLHEVLKGERSDGYGFSKTDPYVASLLYAMDRKESQTYLEELIKNNDVVIFDRYVESNLLHQGGKFKETEERLHFARWLFQLEYDLLQLPKPGIVLYLTIPFWLSRARAARRAEEKGESLDAVEKDLDYVKAGHEAGIFYAEHFAWSIIQCLDNGYELTPNEVHTRVKAELSVMLK